MFGVDSGELFIIILVAVVVIGPKDLPRVMRTVGEWVGRARGMANQFRSGVDQMMRDSEIADLEKKWREQNEAIMRAHPAVADSDWGLPPQPPTTADEAAGDLSADGAAGNPAADAPAPPLMGEPAAATPARGPAPVPVPAAAGMSPGQAKTDGRRAAPAAAPPLVRPAYSAARTSGEAA